MDTPRRHRHPGPRGNDDRQFDAWSLTYDRSPTQVLLFSPVQRTVVAALRRRMGGRIDGHARRALDVGAGTGRLLERLGHALPGVELLGVDRSAGMLSAARRVRPGLHLIRGTAEALPFPDQSLDMVTTTLSFHHWSDQPEALDEVRRVLRPGGLFALADVSVDDLPRVPLVRLIAGRLLEGGLPLQARRRLLEAAGLRVVDEQRALYGRWIPLTIAERGPA